VKASNPKIICTIKENDPSNSHLSFECEELGVSMNTFKYQSRLLDDVEFSDI